MSQSEVIPAEAASLTSHNQPIHIPGSIQPHGLLLVFSEPELKLLQVSNNTQDYLGRKPEDLLGQPLSTLLDTLCLEVLQQCLREDFSDLNALKLSIRTLKGEQCFDGCLHRTTSAAILELEPTDSKAKESFLSIHTLVRGAIAKLKQTSTLAEFLQLAAEELRKMTGFDRVLVYQFDRKGAGAVIAEAKQEELSPYLGLHYPATDVPEQARELYKRGLLRVIPDLSAQPVNLVPIDHPETHQPLDLSLSILRSVNPCCVEFHQNMGVAAILVISLVKDQKLWGLISCHHQTPKHVFYETRFGCEVLGQIVSSELANKVIQEEVDYKAKLESLRSEVVESISQADNFRDALVQPEPRLLGLVGAQGAAVCLDDENTLVGATPSIGDIRALIDWADSQVNDNLFSTDALPKLYPKAEAFKDTVSGLLLLRISKIRRYYILWFRPEVIQMVNWAGNPNESIQLQVDGSVTLCPRKSFAQWQEIVRLTSEPWKACELESAISLRNAIVGIVLKKAEELAKVNLELERSNRELASFAYAASHDLKEPLRGIYNYSTILLEDYTQVLDEEGLEYLQTVRGLSQRMETLINTLLRLSQLGQAELQMQTTDLNELLSSAIAVFRASRLTNQLDIRIPRPLPTVKCDPVLVSEVFSNLISNAFKYNDKAEQWVEIGYLDADEQISKGLLPSTGHPAIIPVFYVRDNGIGIQDHHREIIFKLFKRLHSQEKYGGGAGAGLSITKKIVERHGGRIWVESKSSEGSAFHFTLE